METRVINIHSGAAYDVYIGRAGKGLDGCFGNPIRFDLPCPVCERRHPRTTTGRADMLACYKRWFWERINTDEEFRRRCAALQGKTLGCFCKQPDRDVLCHGDVITAWINAGCPTRA